MRTQKKLKSSPKSKQISSSSRQLQFIDEQFCNIINRKCPGRLQKFVGQRIQSRRIKTDPMSTSLDISEGKSIRIQRIFQKTFFRERQKEKEKTIRIEHTKQNLMEKLRMKRDEPYEFFKLNRKSIRNFQKSIPGYEDAKIRYSQEKNAHRIKTEFVNQFPNQSTIFHRKKPRFRHKIKMHPYCQIFQKTSREVCQHKSFYQNYTQFSPFNNLEPITID